MPETVGAIIVAAGSGVRMGGMDKPFAVVAGRPLLAHALAVFEECPATERIVLVLSKQNLERARQLVKECGFEKVAAVVAGGERRQDSVRLGLEAVGDCDFVAVHDGARPLVTVELIELGIEAARETGAAVPAIPVVDTIKEAGPEGVVVRTLDRSRLWAVQTPQVFRRELLMRAHQEITADVTDDAAMVEALRVPVRLFEGERRNVKVTTQEDLELVTAMLTRDAGERYIYHIARRKDWERGEADGAYRGDTLATDGFVHCSMAGQVVAVANSFFSGQKDLVLLRIDSARVTAEIRYEGTPGGETFPHIYGPLNAHAVIAVADFAPEEDGRFRLPQAFVGSG